MFIPKKSLRVGARVKLKRDIEMMQGTFTKGHEFNVIGDSYRGVDLEDDEGNKMGEYLFIHDDLEII